MPNQITVSMRKYNKELKLSADLRAELEVSQESLTLARNKNRNLRRQLKLTVAEGQELATCQEHLLLEKTKNALLAKRLKSLSDQDDELVSCRNSLQMEKAKNLELKLRLKKVSAPGQRELSAVRSQTRAEVRETHESELKKLVATHDDQIKRFAVSAKELLSIQEKLKHDNEQLRLILHRDAKIPGNLELIAKDPRVTKHVHVINGGRAGAV